MRELFVLGQERKRLHMALQDSSQAREDAQKDPTPVELSTSLIDADGIFGFTSHLLKRRQKVSPSSNVVEGSAGNESLQCGGFSPRKRLNSAEELQRGQRPNPEGSGASLCQRCQLITAELHKQALELAAPETTKEPSESLSENFLLTVTAL
ncbi:hypothetical protein SRHO_G00066150 [Serrasalmus rhombeus]